MRGSVKLGRIAGIEIGFHFTWLFALLIISWSLASVAPQLYPGWSVTTYWVTAVIASLLLFVSVLIHEMAHSLVAKSRGMQVKSITLFIFGGVSNIESEPEQPGTELAMSIVGPLSSLVLAGIFWIITRVLPDSRTPVAATFTYLAWINASLAVFNLLPGFPLDGGRVLRSILWRTTHSLVKATNIAATVGQVFGWLFIAAGVAMIFGFKILGITGLLNGIWIAIIGWFLSSAAEASRQDVTVKQYLSGVRVKDIMNPAPECVSPEKSVQDVVQDSFILRGRRAVPVCRENQLMGIVTLTDVKKLSQDRWQNTPIKSIMTSSPLHTVSSEDDLSAALKLMAQQGLNQVIVTADGQLAGLLSRADIIQYFQLSQELGIKSSKVKS